MLTLFKLANRNLRQLGSITTAARIENVGILNSIPNLMLNSFATTRTGSLDKKQRIEEALDKFENENFGIDWKKFTSYDKETSKEFLEEISKKLEESVITPEQKAEREDHHLKERLGVNYKQHKNKFYKERHTGFQESLAPLPRKLNIYDRANQVHISKSQDYSVSFDNFTNSLSQMTYLDQITGNFQKDWDRELQDVQHYNQLMSEMKNEDYLKGKPANYLLVHNIPKSASRISLLNLVRGFGEVKQFQVRENLFGENAFVEVHYANATDAARAKRELYRKKFQGSSLYPMFVHRRLPTLKQVIKAVDALKLQPEERMRVRIKEYIYDVKQFGIVTAEEKVHTMPGYDFNTEQYTHDSATAQDTEVEDVYSRLLETQTVNEQKFYMEEIAGAFPIYYCCADYSQIQHLLEAPSERSNYSEEQELLRLSFTEREILKFQQELFKVEQQNRGYCFVTFASEDDAKRALVDFTYRPHLDVNLEGTLKLDTNHVDWDAEKFHAFMDAYDAKAKFNKEKILAESKKLKENEEMVAIKDNFHKYALNNDVEKVYYDTQVPKVDLREAELTTEELRSKYTRKQKHFERNLKDNEMYQTMKQELFTESQNFALNLDEEALSADTLQVGRNFDTKLRQKDYIDLLEKLEDQSNKSTKEVSEAAKGYFEELDKLSDTRVLHDLVNTNLAISQLGKAPDASSTEHIIKKIEQLQETKVKNPAIEKLVDDLINYYPEKAMEKEADYEDYLKKKSAREEKRKRRRRTLFSSGVGKFSTVKELEFGEAVQDVSRNASKEEVTKRTLKKLEELAGKIHTGRLTEADFEELYRPRLENVRGQISQDPHFLVRDEQGLQFVTEQDLKRFEEDQAPEDPAELEKFKQHMQKLKQAKERRDKDREEQTKNSTVTRLLEPAMVALLKKGIPLETFEFKASAEYPTIDDYIKQLNKLDEVYTYIKEKDEKGKEIILKVFKKKS